MYELLLFPVFHCTLWIFVEVSLRKNCPYSESFWSVFSPNTGNTDQNNSEYGHFLHSVWVIYNCTKFQKPSQGPARNYPARP